MTEMTMGVVTGKRRRYEDDWLLTVLFSKLPRDLDDGRTTKLWRWSRVAGLSIKEARQRAHAGGVPGFEMDDEHGEIVRIDKAHWDRYGLLSALGIRVDNPRDR